MEKGKNNFNLFLRVFLLKCKNNYKIFAKPGLFFVITCPFVKTMTIIEQNLTILKRIWCVGIRTRDYRMVGTDESTELWWPHVK